MKIISTNKKRFLIILGITTPLVFLFGMWRSIGLFKTSLSSLTVLCLKKIEIVIGYFSHIENILLFAVVGLLSVGFVRGVLFFIRQVYNSEKLKKEFAIAGLKNHSEDIHGIQVCIVNDQRLFAVTVGFLNPIIYISSKLIQSLNAQEIASVMVHEQYHKANYHPLAKLITSTCRSFLFFIPVMPVVVTQLTLRQEALADDIAIEKTSRTSLVSAFLKISQSMQHLKHAPSTVSQFSFTKDRMLLIIEHASIPRFKLPFTGSLVSACVAFLFIISLTSPYTSRVYAQMDSLPRVNMGDTNVCHGINQTLSQIIDGDQYMVNMTPTIK